MKRQKVRQQAGRLNSAGLKDRRGFLKSTARKAAIPALAVYSVHKTASPALGFTPI